MGRSTQQTNALAQASAGWLHAARLVEQYLANPQKADVLLAALPAHLDSASRARCQFLFAGVLRNLSLLQAAVDKLAKRPPRAGLRAMLLVAGYEILESDGEGQLARTVHHAVEMAKLMLSAQEAGFVNALMRRMPEVLAQLPQQQSDPVERLALQFSHPVWLVRRWLMEFGEERTAQLLRWNQTPPPLYVRLEGGMTPPDVLEETPWRGFYRYKGPGWEAVEMLLKTGQGYVQDPSTSHPVELLDPQPGEAVLDLCAAPGGKARQIVARMRHQGTIVCLDLPGERLKPLQKNLPERSGDLNVRIIPADLREMTPQLFAKGKLPSEFDAVLIDAPCSNTGVLRRRPDARWRLKEGDIEQVATLQEALLTQAAKFVRKGGRLVYSTCSIEAAENDAMAERFLAAHPEFRESARKVSLPWNEEHDGAAAYRFER